MRSLNSQMDEIAKRHESSCNGLMKSTRVVVSILILVGLTASPVIAKSKEFQKALDYGAPGKLTMHIVDDRDEPVERARIEIRYFSKSKARIDKEQTDRNGLYIFEESVQVDMNFTVTKEGYYETRGIYNFVHEARKQGDPLMNGRWMPWNPAVPIILKKMRNPIPMYAKELYRDHWIPAETKVGFDFQAGDFVAPYGKGMISDFVLYTKRIEGKKDSIEAKELSFIGGQDGVLVRRSDSWSEFSSEYEAPEEFYLNQLEDRGQHRPSRPSPELNEVPFYYIFKTRTTMNSDGTVKDRKYSKMLAPIQVKAIRNDQVMVGFRYWHNPDGSRNLEFDPKRNLFKSFSDLERVDGP